MLPFGAVDCFGCLRHGHTTLKGRPGTLLAELPPPADAAYADRPQKLEQRLSSDLRHGLTAGEAERRLHAFGPNSLARPRRPNYAVVAARQLADPLVLLLAAAAAVSAAIGERTEAVVIAAIVALNAVLGFVEEARAELAVLALREAVERTAAVVREGRERRVPTTQLVPGDLIVVREGDRAPADARIVRCERLEMDESALTGESTPVRKSTAPCPLHTPLAERASMVFAGTGVTRGRGWALVTATADATEIGNVVELTASASPPPTPLQRTLGRLSRFMVLVGLAVTGLLLLGMLARGASLDEAFLVGVSVAVAAVPEGLAATVTIALAQGARSMASGGAIVRRLSAVETVGRSTVIAADKTGTLTVNQLRLAAVQPLASFTAADVVETGALASTAALVDEDGRSRVIGDPVDGAFLLAATAAGNPDPRTADGRRLLHEVPFDPQRRRLTAVYEERAGRRVVVKGAPETLIALSRLEGEKREELESLALGWASDGLRVLALGQRRLERDAPFDRTLETDLELVGLVALHDPLRPGAAESVHRARSAGLSIALLTGDHPATAMSVARELGLDDRRVITGSEIDELDAGGLVAAAAGAAVFARVTPLHKLRLVEALQSRGEVVVVTGDGINDAPALRQADVGLAMGRSGTEAAREAAEIVLTDDDFATILTAVREGRRIDDNMRKFVAFLLSANLGEVVLFGIAVLGGLGAPMTVIHVLLVNLLTDGLPAVALARDPASHGVMHRKPRQNASLFSRHLWQTLALVGASVGLVATVAYVIGRALAPGSAQTMAFTTIALAELLVVYAVRSPNAPAWREPRNAALAASVVLSAGIVGACLYVPTLADLAGTVALSPVELVIVAALAVVPSALAEIGKWLRRRRPGRRSSPRFPRRRLLPRRSPARSAGRRRPACRHAHS